MNEDAFADLPEKHQKALEEQVFGEPLSTAIGAIWDEIDRNGRAVTEETAGNVITVAGEADLVAYTEIANGVIEAVLGEIKATGVDAQAAYDMVLSEMSAD